MKPNNISNILILSIITLAIFSNTLFNGFAGDDGGLITSNEFYHSWDNFPRIFTKDYLVKSTLDYYGDKKVHNNSGAVSYRPIVSVSLFVDYSLWKLKPFGYHLHNLLLHILCVIAAYFLALRLFSASSTAFLGALIFAAHPLKTEAVAAIGFRQDIQVGLLILLSLLLFIRHQSTGSKKAGFGALLCYFFALFSKETAAAFPLILLAYEFLKPSHLKKEVKVAIKDKIVFHSLFLLITLFYLYIYLYVFPNTVVGETRLMGRADYLYHLLHIPVIYNQYILLTVFPNLVHTVPGLYYPSIKNFHVWQWLLVSFTTIGTAVGFFISLKYKKIIAFLILWYLLFYGPASNIIPLPNPIAYRFLYLPSFGSMLILAWALEKISIGLIKLSKIERIKILIIWGFISLCGVSTFTLNYDWKNNFTLSKSWVKYFPEHPTSYAFLGAYYLDNRMEHYALPNFMKAVELGSNDPRCYYYSAFYNADLPFEQKEQLYKIALKMNPLYESAAQMLGKLYYDAGRYDDALNYFDYKLSIKPEYSTYRYMMLACNELEDELRAGLVLKHAKEHLTDKTELDVIEQLYTNKTKRPTEEFR